MVWLSSIVLVLECLFCCILWWNSLAQIHFLSQKYLIYYHKLICLYGYSFGCFLAIFLLCIIPWGWLHWILMVYGMVNSIAFLILNMMEYLDNLDKKAMYTVYGIIGLAQISLFLTFKLVFFNLIYESSDWTKINFDRFYQMIL